MSALVEIGRRGEERSAEASPGVYIHNFGCQMNVYDAQRMIEGLGAAGYRQVEDPEEADVILLNTCSVREKAEQKLFSALGRYRPLGERGTLIAVGGCLAQQEREKLMERAPYVSLVFGPDATGRVAELVRRAREGRDRVLDVKFTEPGKYEFPRARPDPNRAAATAFVTIQKGCDKACTYCIVPRTRGREVSRPYPEVIREVHRFVETGVREVTLIGQNVNCYHGGCTFAELLRRVAEVPGLRRLRYTTSYPREMGEDVFAAHRDLPVLCRHLHLPVQSGSNRVLQAMRREHSVEEYLDKVDRLREIAPDLSLTTDIIVGFPGETDHDFEQTMELVERVRFDNMFSFVYSDRPRTWAQRHGPELGVVPYDTKVTRLERLQARQREISLERTSRFVGQWVEVLVEGPSRKRPEIRQGHSTHNWVVNFPATPDQAPVGQMLAVYIDRASHFGLSGKLQGALDALA